MRKVINKFRDEVVSKATFAMFFAIMSVLALTSLFAVSAQMTPSHTKNIHPNNDGTYKLSLDVTGESEKVFNKVNVTVIFDISGSMKYNTGNSEVTYTPTDGTGNNLYGVVNGEYVRIYRHQSGYGMFATYYYTLGESSSSERYTGQRYTRQEANQTRLQAAQEAVNSLASALLSKNGKDGNPNDLIQMSLVKFSTAATVSVTATNSYGTFSNAINGLTADGGTNWEDALKKASTINYNDSDQTYVIFVSDGNPTFRNTAGNYTNMDNTYYNDYGVYGNGSDTATVSGMAATVTIARCYDHAVDDAKSLVDAGYTFYTIGAYGDVSRMQSLTTSAGAPSENYYSASSTAALQEALNDILDKIERAGFAEIEINDGTTNKVVTSSGVAELLEVDTSSFQYFRSGGVADNGGVKYSTEGYGEEWFTTDTEDPAPEATLNENGEVIWDLSSKGVLENGVKYTVTFDVYPSQYTYDLIADLNNGFVSYEDLDEGIRTYLVKTSSGNYTLLTNTEATLSYKDTRVTGATTSTATYTNPDPVDTIASEMTINKIWKNTLDQNQASSVKIKVTKDTNDYGETITLSNPSFLIK